MFDIFKFLKKRPTVKRQDLLGLIAATPDASPRTHSFVIPDGFTRDMKWAIGKPFCVCLWWETFEGYSIDASHPYFGEPKHEITLMARRDRKHHIGTTCK